MTSQFRLTEPAIREIEQIADHGTQKEDLGETDAEKLPCEAEKLAGNGQEIPPQTSAKPPGKWEVYEQILRLPYYVVFSRYTNQLRAFRLMGAHYQELELLELRVWISELELGLGLWPGEYQGIERLWLRWYDAQGNWILTEAEQERQRAELAESRLESLRQQLRESGIDPDTLLNA